MLSRKYKQRCIEKKLEHNERRRIIIQTLKGGVKFDNVWSIDFSDENIDIPLSTVEHVLNEELQEGDIIEIIIKKATT